MDIFNQNSNSKPIGSFHVAELAQRADVTPATVRYYSRVGILNPDRELGNDYRCYTFADLRRVVFVRQAKALGLTIGDIKTTLEIVDHGESTSHQVRSVVEQRLAGVQKKLTELRDTERRMRAALESWQGLQDEKPNDGELCPLIERFDVSRNGTERLSCPMDYGVRI